MLATSSSGLRHRSAQFRATPRQGVNRSNWNESLVCSSFFLRLGKFSLHKLVLLLLILSPLASIGESLIGIPSQQCVWSPGGNLLWAAPDLDESGWRPYPQLDLRPGDAQVWVRCHVRLSELRDVEHPAIQVTLFGAYQVFENGQPIGGSGELSSGQFSVNTIRSFPLTGPLPANAIIALHITRRSQNALATLRLYVGEQSVLRDRRSGVVLAQSLNQLGPTLCFGATGVIGLVLLGLFFYDPNRRELLLLSIACLGAAMNNLDSASTAALLNYPVIVSLAIGNAARLMVGATRTWFFFALARRRVPILFWILIGVGIQDHILWEIQSLLPASQALWLDMFRQNLTRPAANIAYLAACAAPFVAFWPYSRITPRMRGLARLCLVWGTCWHSSISLL
jgi:hypothetical protein